MSLFGKILAVLNILAAVGFIALASMDYGLRQSWAYATFLNQLKINGLPLDDKELNDAGRPAVQDLGPKTTKILFPTGKQPSTQVAEVKDVHDTLKGRIEGSSTDRREQMRQYAEVLLPLARTNPDRERMIAYRNYMTDANTQKRLQGQLKYAYDEANKVASPAAAKFDAGKFGQAFLEALNAKRAWLAEPFAYAFLIALSKDPKKPFDQVFNDSLEAQRAQLQMEFEQPFQEVLGGGSKLAPSERRQRVAHLLLNLVNVVNRPEKPDPQNPNPDPSDNQAYKRALTVVGLREAVREINDRTYVLTQIANEARVEMDREEIDFATSHADLLYEVRQRAIQLAQDTEQLARVQRQRDEQQALVNRRKADVKWYEDQLKQTRDQTAERLKELQTMSRALYEERIKLRKAGQENQKLEKEIRRLEGER